MKLELISNEEIEKHISPNTIVHYPTYRAIAQAQLEVDQKVVDMIEGYTEQAKKAMVQEVFEEIEAALFEEYETIGGNKALWFKESLESEAVKIYLLWQALKEKYTLTPEQIADYEELSELIP